MQRIEGTRKFSFIEFEPTRYGSLRCFREMYNAANQCPISCTNDSKGIASSVTPKLEPVNESKYFKSISNDTKLLILFKIHHSIIPIIIAHVISLVLSMNFLDAFTATTSMVFYHSAAIMYTLYVIFFSLMCMEVYLYSWWNDVYNEYPEDSLDK